MKTDGCPFPDPEELIRHTGWMQRLALGLLGDHEAADDAVQRAWLRALESPPRRDGAWAPWLRVITRNVSLQDLRGDGRRRQRERRAAAPREPEGPAELAVKAEAHRLVVAELLQLEEPYRETLLLLFFGGRTPKQAAAELGVAVDTVRSRLHRGLKKLRQRLQGKWGEEWQSCCLPLVGALPVLSVGSLLSVAASLLVVAGLSFAAWGGGEGERMSSGVPLTDVEADSPLAEPSLLAEAAALSGTPARAPFLDPSADDGASLAASPAWDGVVSGHLWLDEQLAPAGTELILEAAAGEKRSEFTEAAGAFRFEGLPQRGSYLVTVPFAESRQVNHGGWVETLWRGVILEGPAEGLELSFASIPRLRGRILRPDGEPAQGALVSSTVVYPFGGTISTGEEAESGADGRFLLRMEKEVLPDSARLRVSLPGVGFLDRIFPAEELARSFDLGDLVLEPVRSIRFRVVDVAGNPLEAAWALSESARSSPTAADGRAVLHAPAWDDLLGVSCAGFLPAFVPLTGFRGEELVVQLRAGAALDLRVLLEDRFDLRRIRVVLKVAEGERLFAGEEILRPLDLRVLHSGYHLSRRVKGQAWHLRGNPDADGRFFITGVVPGRPIQLLVRGPAGCMLDQVIAPLGPAEQRRIELDLRGRARVFRGRVVDQDGAPIAGAWIWLSSGDGGSSNRRAGLDGEFEFSPAFGDWGKGWAEAPGYREIQLDRIDLRRQGVTDIVLPRGRTVRLEVRDPAGGLVANGAIGVEGHAERLEPNGTFNLVGIPESDTEVTLRYFRTIFRQTVPAGVSDFVIVLPTMGKLEVEVSGVDVFVRDYLWVMLSFRRLRPDSGRSETFQVPASPSRSRSLEEGEYQLELVRKCRFGPNKGESTRLAGPVEVSIRAGETTKVLLQAKP